MESARLPGLGDAAALINEGLYQLGAHDWCVSAGAVTQLGAGRRVTPLFTEHKERKQAAATSAPPSVNSRAFHEDLPLQQRAAHRPALQPAPLSFLSKKVLWSEGEPITKQRP